VWECVNDDSLGERAVRPVKSLPVKHLTGRLIGTQVRLANGAAVWALIGNIDAGNPKLTEHFITMSLERGARWFHLARYHDPDCAERGPEALARFLGLALDDVFPISYDVRQYANGHDAALAGVVGREPRERLTRAQIIALAVP
jgi:hypothetical protein